MGEQKNKIITFIIQPLDCDRRMNSWRHILPEVCLRAGQTFDESMGDLPSAG